MAAKIREQIFRTLIRSEHRSQTTLVHSTRRSQRSLSSSHKHSDTNTAYTSRFQPQSLQPQASRVESAYLQSLLRDAGVDVTAAATNSRKLWRLKLFWFFLGLGTAPFVIFGVGYVTALLDPDSDAAASFKQYREAKRQLKASSGQQQTVDSDAIDGAVGIRPLLSAASTAGFQDIDHASLMLPGTPSEALGPDALPQVLALTAKLKALEKIAEQLARGLKQYKDTAEGYREMALHQHKQLIEVLGNTVDEDLVVLDRALLQSRPITLQPSGKTLDTEKAALVRVLDEKGKNRMIILAVDVTDEDPTLRRRPEKWPGHCFGLHTWMLDLAEELQHDDLTSERGVDLFCVSRGVLVDVGTRHGHRVRMTYDVLKDTPAGFPLKQLKGIFNVQYAFQNILNLEDMGEDDDDDDDEDEDDNDKKKDDDDNEGKRAATAGKTEKRSKSS